MAHLLGIDLGSTSIKAVAYDLAGNIAASHSVPAEIKYLDSDHPTWAFWDPDIVWNSTITVIKMALPLYFLAVHPHRTPKSGFQSEIRC